MPSGRVNSQRYGPAEAYGGPHDYAYVYPSVVARLTAAALTYVFNGRRFGGRSRISLRNLRGPAAGDGGLGQGTERE